MNETLKGVHKCMSIVHVVVLLLNCDHILEVEYHHFLSMLRAMHESVDCPKLV